MSMYNIWNNDIKHHQKPESLWEIKTRELPGIKAHWRPAASKFEVEEAFNMGGNKNNLKRIDVPLHDTIVLGYPN